MFCIFDAPLVFYINIPTTTLQHGSPQMHQNFQPLQILSCRHKSDSRPWHAHYAPLTGTDVQVQQQKQSWHDHYKNVQAASTDNPVGEDDLVWALECVRSRAFSGPYSGKSQATGLTAQTPVMARHCLR